MKDMSLYNSLFGSNREQLICFYTFIFNLLRGRLTFMESCNGELLLTRQDVVLS